MRIALVDGDILAFESACSAITTPGFDGQKAEPICDLSKGIANVDARIETVQEAAGADRVIIALSDRSVPYFRKDLYPAYKAHRGPERPMSLGPIVDHLKKNYRTQSFPRLEADDILGILATTNAGQYEKVIVTSDKDLRQIPGLHLNHQKLSMGVSVVTREEGDLFHLMQTLMGDTTDNYPGCPGIGPVKARKIVEGGWPAVVEAFVKKGLTEQDALLQARLARILQAENWDSKKKEIKPWTPK